MGLLPDTQNCGLRIRRECREHFPRYQRQMKPPVSDPDMHHGTCVTHVLWGISGSLTRCGGENVPDIPGACATHIFRIWQEAHKWCMQWCFFLSYLWIISTNRVLTSCDMLSVIPNNCFTLIMRIEWKSIMHMIAPVRVRIIYGERKSTPKHKDSNMNRVYNPCVITPHKMDI